MICFSCATPYHILLSLFIRESYFSDEKADLILYNHFENSHEVYQILQKDNKFSKIFYLDENNRMFINRLKRGIRSIYPGSLIRDLAHKSSYDKIIFFALDFLNNSYIIKGYNMRNLCCKFCYGEDGIGTYMDPMTYVPSKIVDFLLIVTKRKKWLRYIDGLYVLAPSLLQCSYYQEIYKINVLSPSLILEYCRKTLWPQSKNIKLNRVIYLQEPFKIPNNSKENQIINLIEDLYANEYSIKLHPRATNFNGFGNKQIIKTTIPFECLVFDSDLDNSIIISILCTAAISPGLLYNKSPYVIFIYKLFPELNQCFDLRMTIFLEYYKKTMSYSTKMFVPNNLEELKKILFDLSKK